MTRVTFISAGGKKRQDVDAPAGAVLLDVAQNAGLPLEGTCEGQMACSTCHVIVGSDDFEQIPRATDAEEDMLDLAAAATRTSRLSCQIVLSEAMKHLTIHIPSECHDMRGM